jgi:PAS domain S-box-containing protein
VLLCLQTLFKLFGYERGELDGKNVTVLMPTAFSQRHASYLQRYAATGEARILDTQREVLAVHKDHSVFPISIGIMRMSGTGNDSMFLAVIKAAPQDEDMARMWIMPTGLVSPAP